MKRHGPAAVIVAARRLGAAEAAAVAIPVVGAEAANAATKRRGPAAETMAVAEIRGAAVRRHGAAVGAAADPVAAMAADVAAVVVGASAVETPAAEAADPVAATAAADVAAVAGAVAGPAATVVAGPAAGAAEVDSLFACPGCLPNRGTLVA